MSDKNSALMAHLMRRAAFGAGRDELEARVAIGYEETVEELLRPEEQQPVDMHDLLRYHPWTWKPGTIQGMGHASWLYRMLNTNSPLQEKMTLFWHGIFATGVSKVDHWDEIIEMVDTFREKGMDSYRDLLVEAAKSPAMIYWLDNNENHAHAVNENWGRELLELFSMGVGNYTEEDVRECSRAFTGWTITPKLPRFPMGRFDWFFEYREEDHDDGEKTFLGQTGRFNGEDIIDIICRQPATALFICRHLYNFFVADEPQVPSWNDVPPLDPEGIAMMEAKFIETGGDIRSVLRVMFNSDFFKAARYKKVKSPTEFIVGVLKMVGSQTEMAPGMTKYAGAIDVMGQKLLDPPTVEGWHTGGEWIDGGNLTERVNFAVDEIGEGLAPGIQSLVQRMKDSESLGSAESLVNGVLAETGYVEVSDRTREALIDFANDAEGEDEATRVIRLLRLAVATPEYQFA